MEKNKTILGLEEHRSIRLWGLLGVRIAINEIQNNYVLLPLKDLHHNHTGTQATCGR